MGERPGPWPEGDYWLHGDDLYNPGIQVPVIVFDPRHTSAGLRIRAPLQHIDLMPTILELVGARMPAAAEGRSIVPLLTGRSDGLARVAYTTLSDDRASSIVTADGYKLIAYWHTGARELYDENADPDEGRNLYRSNPAKAAELEALLTAWARAGGINTDPLS